MFAARCILPDAFSLDPSNAELIAYCDSVRNQEAAFEALGDQGPHAWDLWHCLADCHELSGDAFVPALTPACTNLSCASDYAQCVMPFLNDLLP